ncbi:hydroxyacid dehydrogenase [Salsuginibacillus kocurii]|uniref:hydroxyacid dehydrogenase n=1 Tax=Salsuginibacillus kocurii TaxID=427078 RepID=UPI00036CDDDA|nr:hydroxyacid dehydrogenase [Salsuginibacillus kocurii]
MKVVITEMNWPEGINLLKQHADVTYEPSLWKDREQLLVSLEKAEALIVRNQTQVDEELLTHAPNLKVIGRLGVGLDNIDLEAARSKEIPVVFARNANAISVSEYVLSTILMKSRNLFDVTASVKAGKWDRRTYTGEEVFGKTIGFIGLGEIGMRLARRAKALGMNVVGYDPFMAPFDYAFHEVGLESRSFENVLEESNFITLHVPFNKHTENLIGENELNKMKENVTIINTSRGGIINEPDLYSFLSANPKTFAILDVFQQEPPAKEHPIFNLENVLLTPHISGLTEQSQQRTSIMVAEEVLHELNGQKSLCRV